MDTSIHTRRVLASIVALALAAHAASAQFDITRSTVDGGGSTVGGGTYTLTGTIGQPATLAIDEGVLDLAGGFWPSSNACGAADITTTGLATGLPDGIVDLSDFSFYLSLWASGDSRADITVTGNCVFELEDASVDLSDFSCYLASWALGCP
ncbi:MAG: GC-type dockerin domain-anchored protein [Planctomycetota bacterium]